MATIPNYEITPVFTDQENDSPIRRMFDKIRQQTQINALRLEQAQTLLYNLKNRKIRGQQKK